LIIDARGSVVTRINGYLPPAPFMAALDYVVEGVYRREPDLQRYLKSRGEPSAESASRVDQ
jgi:thioredoxin-related protein